jgi:DNA helicase HerA-like ATPase
MSLREAINAKYLKQGVFKHITLIDEAHRLFSKYMVGDSLDKKQGIEMFTDIFVEARKYGESLIIVDQKPDKLSEEVLRNTNTKIVHRIFDIEDREAIGNAMMLSADQKNYLSKLETGRAIVFIQGFSKKAIQVQISMKREQL